MRCVTPPAADRIRVRCELKGQSIEVTVSDTGRGIAPSDLPHIFERYTKSSDSRGSGLGLAIAKDLVEAHGGHDHRSE